jgi:hypothetical protein
MSIWIIEPETESFTAVLKDQIARMGHELGVLPLGASEDRLRRERRLYPRVPCFLLVDFATQGCAYRAFIRNISADGAFIQSQRPVPPGPDVTLVISLPDDRSPVKIVGDIAWTGEEGMGVRFNPIADFLLDKFLL